jgi:Mn2+/Fe2+ NRAMP family transporter
MNQGPSVASPFAEWFELRDELTPYIGERAFALFALAVCASSGNASATAYFRQLVIDSGDDPDRPQVTETEQLLITWGRMISVERAETDAALAERFANAFNPALRRLLVRFAAIMIATNIVDTVDTADASAP